MLIATNNIRNGLLCGLLLFVGTAQASPSPLNYDPDLPAPAPVLDAGWTSDEIDAESADSLDSPYVYDLASSAIFRITDQFVTGDQFFVYDFGSLILTTLLDGAQATLFPVGDTLGQEGWTSASYQHGETLLSAGAHNLTVQGDGVGGVPAGFFTRLDSSVPEPATFALFSLGLAGLGFARRRKSV